MEKSKKLLGVALLAWLMLLFSAASLAGLDAKMFFALYKFFPDWIVCSLYWYGVFAVGVGIIAGIGILRSKEIARKLAVGVSLLDLLVGIPIFFYLPNIMRAFREMVVSVMQIRPVPSFNDEVLSRSEFYFTAVGALTAILLNLIFIYYFTRPKVKEQFK